MLGQLLLEQIFSMYLNFKPWVTQPPSLLRPKFDGTQKEWGGFKDLFTANIINDGRLSDAVKLQHLAGNVSGPAKKALKGIPISSANFQIAWKKP